MEPAPRPDPKTGKPRPPKAPTWRRFSDGADRNWNFRPPHTPEGRGPALASYAQKASRRWKTALFLPVLIIVAIALLNGGDFKFFIDEWWWPVGILAVGLFFSVFLRRGEYLAAGSDWLQDRKTWIDTYDLKKVDVYTNTDFGMFIELTDHQGRRIHAFLSNIQEDQLLWDLVYNGIAYSVAHGDVEIKGFIVTERALQLDRFRPEAGSTSE